MSVANVRKAIEELGRSAEVLGVLGAVLVAQRDSLTLDPTVAEAIAEVLEAANVQDTDFDNREGLDRVIGTIRSQLLQAAHMTDPNALEPGWWYTSREVLEAQGQGSGVAGWRQSIFPHAEGLQQRLLEPGGSFLDVGVGVAGIAIAAARMWPALRVVGIDPWEPALEIAREHVASAGLSERIELRREAAESLPDKEAFDLIWLPSMFMPSSSMNSILVNLKQALRVGGWLMCIVRPMPDDDLGQALERLRTATRGSFPQDTEQVAALMQSVGYKDIRIILGTPNVVLGCYES